MTAPEPVPGIVERLRLRQEITEDGWKDTLFSEAADYIARLTASTEGHDEPCYYCGEPCDALAGNPSLWPLGFPHKDDPGVVKWQHVGCVLARLPENAAPTEGEETTEKSREVIAVWAAPTVLKEMVDALLRDFDRRGVALTREKAGRLAAEAGTVNERRMRDESVGHWIDINTEAGKALVAMQATVERLEAALRATEDRLRAADACLAALSPEPKT
jgi:hypothetical protein